MTSSSDVFSVLVFIIVLVILHDLYLWNTANGLIRQCVKQNGMLNIKIARNWFTLNGSILKFDVTYTMPNGIRYENSCKMYIRWFSLDNDIVWRDPL